MSVVEKLLARIKTLFEPSRPAAPPPQQLEEALAPAATVTEPAETLFPEPVSATLEPPPVEEPPALIAEPPPPVREAASVLEETPTVAEEAPVLIDEASPDMEPIAPAAAGGLTLRLETERGPRSMFEVTKSGATIGRGPESTIQLADLSVSRKHAKITYKQGAYWLSDLGSMGGTWIDGSKLAAPRRVAAGQTIDIGLCRLSVISAGADQESPAAKGPSHAASGSSR